MKSCWPAYWKNWICILVVFAPLAGVGGGVGGSISGTIRDTTGAVIAGASVSATNCETKVRKTTVSNDRGNYAFPVLPVGRYDLEAVHRGSSLICTWA